MNFIAILIIGLFFLGFFLILEIVKRHYKVNAEYTRKAAHVIGGLAVIFSSNYVSKSGYLFLTVFFLGFIVIAFRKKWLQSLNGISRKSYGDVTYLTGLILLGFMFFNERGLFIVSLLLLIFPDALAGLVGYQFNKNKKTMIGSFVYFIVAFGILFQFIPAQTALFLSLLLTTTEFLSPYGTDNLTVPLAFTLFAKLFF